VNTSNKSATDKIKKVPKPWGYEIWWAQTEKYIGKILHVNKGHSMSFQYHREKDETLYVHSGNIVLEIENEDGVREKMNLRPGDAYRITPLTRHRITALEDSDILEASTHEVDDIVRLEDNYGRV